MAVQADAHLVSSFRSLSKISGGIVGLIGGAVLAGWILDVPSLKSILPDTPQMVPNTALTFILTGASLRMLLNIESSSWDPEMARRCREARLWLLYRHPPDR